MFGLLEPILADDDIANWTLRELTLELAAAKRDQARGFDCTDVITLVEAEIASRH